jgi:resuscitation-promoting factor RpfB
MRSEPTRSARSQKTQQIFAAIVSAAILLLSVTGFVWAQKQVSVVVDGQTFHIATQSADVASLLSEAGVTVGAEDLVFPSRDTKIAPGLSVVVRHAVPVKVALGGTESTVRVVGETVADALVAAGVDPSRAAGVSPALDSPLAVDMRISVPDSFARVRAENCDVPFAVNQRPDGTLPEGVTRTLRPGVSGSKVSVYRTVVTGGVEGSATLVSERVINKPVTEVVAIGTGDGTTAHQLAVAGVPAKVIARMTSSPAGRPMRVVATAYSADEPGATSATASGVRAERGVIAVDPDVIPLGTHLYVPGYGYGIAGDTGGMINGRHIDLCFDSMAELHAWGKRTVTLILLD